LLVSDCIDLVRSLIKVTKEHGIEKNVIKSLLDQKTRFHGKFIKPGRFLDIVEGRFQIDDIIQVNRKNDEHTISNKIFDFSLETINLLFEERYNDAHNGFKEYIESKNKEQLTV
jgi:NTE family protein